jgi:hypothetical protein
MRMRRNFSESSGRARALIGSSILLLLLVVVVVLASNCGVAVRGK